MIRTLVMAGAALSLAGAALAAPQTTTPAKPATTTSSTAHASKPKLDCKLEKNKAKKICKAEAAAAASAATPAKH